jgi:hypothetical protein
VLGPPQKPFDYQQNCGGSRYQHMKVGARKTTALGLQ